MTETDAINEILEALGEQALSGTYSGDGTGGAIEDEAKKFLDRYNARVQENGPGWQGGWWCNTVLNKTYSPDGVTSKVALTSVLKWYPSSNQSDRIGEKGGYLYNFTDETDEFSSDIKLDVVLEESFTNLPLSLQRLVVKEAAQHLVRVKRPGQADVVLARQDLDEARAEAIREHRQHEGTNLLHHGVAREVTGVRNRRTFSSDT